MRLLVDKLFAVLTRVPLRLIVMISGRASGYVRDAVLAVALGATPLSDLFVYAFRLQLALRAFMADQTANSLFTPAYLAQAQGRARSVFLNQVLTCLCILVIPAILLLVLAQPVFLSLFAPGFEDHTFTGRSLSSLAFVIGVYASAGLLIISLSSPLLSQLQSTGRFAYAFAAPIIFNLVLAAGICLTALGVGSSKGADPVHQLGWTFILASISQLIFAAVIVHQTSDQFWRFQLPLWKPVRSAFSMWSRQAIAKSLEPLPFLFLFAIGTQQVGGVTKLFLAERLFMLVPSIAGLYLASIHVTRLSRMLAEGHFAAGKKVSIRRVVTGLLIGVVFIPGLWIGAPLITRVLFQYGAFDAEAGKALSDLFRILLIALPFATAESILTQSLFVMRRYRPAIIASSVSLLFVIVASFALPDVGTPLTLLAWLLATVYVIRGTALLVGLLQVKA